MTLNTDVLQHLITRLDKNSKADVIPLFEDMRFSQEKFDPQKFHLLESATSASKVAFIDGGNVSLISTPELSLDVIRVAVVLLSKEKYFVPFTADFTVLTVLEHRLEGLFFVPKIFVDSIVQESFPAFVKLLQELETKLSFSVNDPAFTVGNRRASLAIVCSLMRRCAELYAASVLMHELSSGDVVILDGSLSCMCTQEEEVLQQLLSHADASTISVVALSKTSETVTTDGNSFASVLQQQCSLPRWMYTPAGKFSFTPSLGKGIVSFVKLHERSQHIFRLDTLEKLSIDQRKQTAEILASNATDPVFYGYPYGLIKADVFARIGNDEKEYLLTKFLVHAGKHAEKLRQLMHATNAHGILDKIRY